MYDVVIIGGGPCGVTAGIYAKRSGLKTLIIEKSNIGGQVINTYEIKNFPTYNNINGADFCLALYDQASFNEIEIKDEEVVSVQLDNNIKKVTTNIEAYETKTIIIATGAKPRMLGLENEIDFIGKGISYCALCDGNFYKDKVVAVIGGGDSALEDAIYLSAICKKVYIINRSEKLRAQNILQNSLKTHIQQSGNIELLYNANVVKIVGENKLEEIEILFKTGEQKTLTIDGMFLAIGHNPDTSIYKNKIDMTKEGYIIVNEKMQTNIAGVFAGGDCIQKQIRQILTACSDGAVCATNANHYIKGE